MAKQTSRPCLHQSCNNHDHLTHPVSHHTQTSTSSSTSKLHHHNNSSAQQTHINFHSLPKHIILLTFTILLTCITPTVSANALYISEQMVETPKNLVPAAPAKPEDPRTALERLALSGPILVDLSPPPQKDPVSNTWVLATLDEDLKRRKRQVGQDEPAPTSKAVSSTKAATSTVPTQASSTIKSPSSSTSIVAVAEETGTTPLPKVFDSGFGGNLTNSCQSYMDNMLADKTFQSCLPLSMLLASSNGFFQTMKSVLLTSRLLDTTCAANVDICTPLLDNLATNLTLPTTCQSDFNLGNPQIRQAQSGLLAYKPLYTATCLRNAKTSSYCFADAVTNKTSPTDGYVYWIPLNNTMPADATPSCSQCLKDTMAVFSGAEAGGRDGKGGNKALGHTYPLAAQLINKQCGPSFVGTSLSSAVVGAADVKTIPSWMALFSVLIGVATWLL